MHPDPTATPLCNGVVRWLLILVLNSLLVVAVRAQTFVGTSGANFILNGQSFFFSGVNNYYLIYKSNRMVDDVLTNAVAMNLKVIRALGFMDGASKDGKVTQPALGTYDPSGFERVDYFVARARQLGLKLLIPFVNNWDDFGGMNWYVGQTGGGSHEDFYTRAKVKAAYEHSITYFLTSSNQYTGVRYTDEPAIFAWELANEPRSTDATCASLPIQIRLSGQTGRRYAIQVSSDLLSWTPVTTNQLAGTSWNWTDPQAPNPLRRFSRAVRLL